MVGTVRRSVLYCCSNRDRPLGFSVKAAADITVCPAERRFIIDCNGKSTDFYLELFSFLDSKPKHKSATQFDIYFASSDPRKSLHLKFNNSDDLHVIYDALLPMFEKENKIKKTSDLEQFFASSPGGQVRKKNSSSAVARTSQVDVLRSTSASLSAGCSNNGKGMKSIPEEPVLKCSQSVPPSLLNNFVKKDVSPTSSNVVSSSVPHSQNPKMDAENVVVVASPLISTNPTIETPTYAVPSCSSVVVNRDKRSYAQATKSSTSPVDRVGDAVKEEATSGCRVRPFTRNRRKLQVSLNLKEQILKSPWRFRSFINLGNSCYMNSVLQMIFFSTGVRNRLSRLSANEYFSKKCTGMLSSLFDLEQKMISMQNKLLSDDDLQEGLRKELENIREESGKELDAEFSSYRQQDAHEYWTKLLDRIEKDIMDYEKVTDENDVDRTTHELSQPSSNQVMARTSVYNKLLSPGDVFKMQIINSLSCSHCGKTKDARTEEFLDMKLDICEDSLIEESVAFLIKKCLSIEELELKCEDCGMTEANRTQAVHTFPQYLLLVVKRYDYSGYGRKKNNRIIVDRDLFLADIHIHSTLKEEERETFLKKKSAKSEPYLSSATILPDKVAADQAKAVFSYSDILTGKKINADPLNAASNKPASSFERTITQGGTESSIDMEVGISSPVAQKFSSNDREKDDDSLLIVDATVSETVSIFKPLSVPFLVRLRKQLGIPKMFTSDDDHFYDSMFRPDCELFPAETPEVVTVDGDGNCLFRSISWWLFNGDDSHYDSIRQKVVKFLYTFPEEFSPLLSEDINMNEYIGKMRNDGEWGSHVELSASATMFGCPVFTYHKNSWQRFSPRFPVVFNDEMQCFEKGSDKIGKMDLFTTGAVYLSNEEGVHYNPVIGRKIRNEKHCLNRPSPFYMHRDSTVPVYTLTGVINHLGATMTCGHYKAMTYDEAAGVWLNCDDAVISVISEKEVLEEAGRNGYLLIYKKRMEGDEMEFTHSDYYLK